jgi:transcriptional regulator with XRE-family HTH domain
MTDAVLKRWGDNLYRRRQELDLTLKDVATQIGVSEASVSRWEHGLHPPRLRHQVALSQALGCPASELFPVEVTW